MEILNSRSWAPNTISGYLYSTTGLALAFIVRYQIHPYLGPNLPVLFFLFNVLVSAYKFGWKPASISAIASIILAYYFFIPPYNSFDLENPIDAANLLLYSCLFGISIYIIEKLQRERYRATLIARVCESRMRVMAKLSSKNNQLR